MSELSGKSERSGRGRPSRREMSPEERVEAAVSMTNVVTRLCIGSIREREPWLTEEQLIAKARARFMFGRERGRQA